jgi:CRISPR locus-related DNA-binding protein
MAKVLISTIYEGRATPIVVYKLSPAKLILLVTHKEDEKRKKAVEEIKSKFGGLLQIEIVKTDEFDVTKITQDVLSAIRKEEGNEIYIHVSEARKTMMLGALFAGYVAKDGVKGIYYVREDNNEILSLPLLDFKLGATKEELLRELDKGDKDAVKISEKLKIHKSIVYVHIKDLQKRGYLTEDWALTPAGKIVVMK